MCSSDLRSGSISERRMAQFFGGASIYPITIDHDKIYSLQSYLMLFFTGFSRNASDIAAEQIRKMPEKKAELKAMMEMVGEAVDVLNSSQDRLVDFGKLLHESWQIKRSLTQRITNSFIDETYEVDRKSTRLNSSHIPLSRMPSSA